VHGRFYASSDQLTMPRPTFSCVAVQQCHFITGIRGMPMQVDYWLLRCALQGRRVSMPLAGLCLGRMLSAHRE
jgi:hypothetical protein